ncbi:MAG: RHS repeat-associated core domain-containing protein [Clostridia bacterium]|nr:RHS repeat-associated core domain-containing protein [Clostridia bacterium]
MISRTGTTDVIFLYNGSCGVITDSNGLIYMRARYYSPEFRRFVNADILMGDINNSPSLNRYAYANGNPISNIDPFGLAADEGRGGSKNTEIDFDWSKLLGSYYVGSTTVELFVDDDVLQSVYNSLRTAILTAQRPNNIAPGVWAKQVNSELKWVDDMFGASSKLAKGLKTVPYVSVGIDALIGVYDNINNGTEAQKVISDVVVDVGFGISGIAASTAIGTAVGSVVPVAGNIIGGAVGFVVGMGYYVATDVVTINGKSIVDWTKDGFGWLANKIAGK